MLFGDEKYEKRTRIYLSAVIKDLRGSLMAAGAFEILTLRHNSCAVDTAKFSCDLYEYENRAFPAINTFRGEYMRGYDWADATRRRL